MVPGSEFLMTGWSSSNVKEGRSEARPSMGKNVQPAQASYVLPSVPLSFRPSDFPFFPPKLKRKKNTH